MSPLALGLILVAAVAHAVWNLVAKRVGGGASFVWLFGVVSAVAYAPLALAVIVLERPRFGLTAAVIVAGSGLLHLAYFVLLQRGYRTGDLSLIYPLARGTGPLLSTVAAITVLGERPPPLALAGAAIVVAGGFVLATGPRSGTDGAAVGFGLLCGLTIAAYTLWDRQAVAVLRLPPLAYQWAVTASCTLLLTPAAAGRRTEVRRLWTAHRRETIAVALLSPLSYVLVLTALVFTPVSYVAPAREISILIGAVLGARLLGEGNARRRLAAAAAMVVGIAALALA